MMDGDVVAIVAGDTAALLLAWLAGSVVLHLIASTSWRVAFQRSLGLSLVALAALLLMRQALPDLFVLPFVFFVVVAVDILTTRRAAKPADRYVISILISLSIIGSFVVVDIILRAMGYHLTSVI